MKVLWQKNILIALSAVLAVLFFQVPAHADGAGENGWVGGMFGLSVPNADNTTSRTMYGLTAGAKVGTEFGIGLYYLTSRQNETMNSVSTPFNYDLYGVDFGYYFEGEAKGVYFGGKLGTSKLSTNNAAVPAQGVTTSPMHYGVFAGYNYMIGSNFSVGGEASYISISSSNGNNLQINSFSMLDFLLSVKAWF